MRVNLGKGEQEVLKGTGFAHIESASTRLGPDNSTQVVDFPCMYEMKTFLDTNLASQARHEMVAPVGCSLARNVVANPEKENRMDTDFGRDGQNDEGRGNGRIGASAFWWRLSEQTVQLSALKCA